MTLVVNVVGLPAPQGSHKGFVVKGRAVITSDNKKTRPWRQDVTAAVVDTIAQTPDFEPYTGPVLVDIGFYMPRPRYHFRTGKRANELRPDAPHYVDKKPDLDKLVRAILDALTASAVFRDDAQVAMLVTSKAYADAQTGARITITSLTPTPSPRGATAGRTRGRRTCGASGHHHRNPNLMTIDLEPTIGALFAGYGGLEMGVQAALGGTLAWYSEIDKGALKILTHRHPDVPNIGDVTTADWSQVEPVDILTGGSPCQDLSHAGKRAGMTDGTRSNLWVAMREAIAQLRPGLVVWENVRGASSAEATSDLEFCPGCMGDPRLRGPVLRALGRVVGDLADLGYVGRIRGLRAADVGAPHGRFRYILAAHPEGHPWRLGHGDGAATALAERGGREWRGPIQLGRASGDVAGDGAATADADELGRGTTRGDNGIRPEGLESGNRPLLPTPATSDTNGPRAHGDGGLDLRTAVSQLLPTPRVGGQGANEAELRRNSPNLETT
jgi:site-specific DNA-cytosine methylase/Holliday junction resolvase RusA-like endonuclease